MKYQRFVEKLTRAAGADGVNGEVANEAELDLYFCDLSPAEHANALAAVDHTIDTESLSLLLQGSWHAAPALDGIRLPI